jgi:hypothetical protein
MQPEEKKMLKEMKPRTKKIVITSGIVVTVLGVATLMATIFYEDIRGYLGYSPKTTKPKDKIVVVTTNPRPLPNVPALKKKAKAKKATKKATASKKSATGKKKVKKPTTGKKPTADKDKPLALREAERKNRCAELPFSYEFAKGDPDAKDHFYKHFWGPNYGCFLAGAHDRRMPGPVPQVRARLEKMSPRRFARYQIRLEKIMRRFACRTFDYYLSTCKEVFDSTHKNYLLNEDLRGLFQRPAFLHDVSPLDRYRVRRAKQKHTKIAKPTTSAELLATTDGTTKPQQRRRLRVSLKTRQLPPAPRLCSNKLKPCPKP